MLELQLGLLVSQKICSGLLMAVSVYLIPHCFQEGICIITYKQENLI